MVKRRDLLGGGLAGGLLGALAGTDVEAGSAEPAAAQRQPALELQEVVDAIVKLRDELSSQHAFNEIAAVRNQQRSFLRTNLKMPDFLEVGASTWFALYDWHVRWQQELQLGRDGQGRYTILFMGTTVILRPDNQDTYIGTPYDSR